MKIVKVIPLKKGIFREDLTYFTAKDVQNGDIVTITLRSKEILGLVLSCENVSDTKIGIKEFDFNLKKIISIKGKSFFLEEYIESVMLVADYFASNKNNAFVSMIPAVFIEKYEKIAKLKTNKELEEKKPDTDSVQSKNIKAEKIILQEPFVDRISIYKTLIRENFALKKSVFIVLPTEMDIRNLTGEISKGIKEFTFIIHGKLNAKKIIDKFEQIVSTEHPILILGTAIFLSIPRHDIGTIIMEHESGVGYRMLKKPYFDLRTFVEIFASKINAKLILADTILRFETIARQDLDSLAPMHPLSFRTNFKGNIKIENPRNKKETVIHDPDKIPIFEIFSKRSIEKIQETIARKRNVFIFTLRKGLSTQTLCRDCGETVTCKNCQAPIVLYNLQTNNEKDEKRIFVCNKCGEEKSGETICANCGSWNLIPLGIGTDTVFEYLKEFFPKNKILKLDKGSIKNKKEAEKIVKDFEENLGSILIGTEMALFYLKNKVSLSIIASFDSLWSIPNFKMSEKIIQLAVSIISKTENEFIIQTKNENDPAVLAILNRNLLPFVREELEDRKNMFYPPFARFIKIKYSGNKVENLEVRQRVKEIFQEYKPLVFSGFVSQTKGKYVTNVLIKIKTKEWSLPFLSPNSSIDKNLMAKLLSLPQPAFEIFVDPEDLL